MPTYDYQCDNCGHSEEIFCKVSEREEQRCGECSQTTRQVIRHAPRPHWTSLAMGASASPEAIKMFDKMRREQKAKEDKSFRDHGDYGKAPGA